MSRRWVAYLAYAVGSVVFLVTAVLRGSVLLGLGSGLFLLGTLLFLGPGLRRAIRQRDGRPDDRREGSHPMRAGRRRTS